MSKRRLIQAVIVAVATLATTTLGMTSSVVAQSRNPAAKAVTWKTTGTGAGSFNVVSCATSNSCVAIGTSTGTDNAVEFNHGRWGTARKIEQYAGEVVSLSCPSAGWCVALTDLAAATVFTNGSWSKLTTIDPNPGPPYPGMANAASCTSSSFCVAVDGQGNSEEYDGTSWTKPRNIDPDYPLNDVSCSMRNYCVAVDGGGRLLYFSEGHWTLPKQIDSTALTGVSCPTTKFCVAVDLLGRALTFDGSHWSTPKEIDTVADVPLAVSCPKVERCIAVDNASRTLILDDKSWTNSTQANTDFGLSAPLVDVSCPSGDTSLCVAVDSSGNVLTTTSAFGHQS